MTAVDSLTSELAFKANVAAVSRDYVCEPHLGGRAIAATTTSSTAQHQRQQHSLMHVYRLMRRVPDRGWRERAPSGRRVRQGGFRSCCPLAVLAPSDLLGRVARAVHRSPSIRRSWRCGWAMGASAEGRCWRWMGSALWCKCLRAPQASTTARPLWSSLGR